MDIRGGGGGSGGEEKKETWHYLVAACGVLMGAFLLFVVVSIMLTILSAGVVPFLITAAAIWGFLWVITRVVRIGRANGWFDKIEKW